MSGDRTPSDLVARSRELGFTPGARHIGPLLTELSRPELGEDAARPLAKALLRAGAAVHAQATQALGASVRPARGRLTDLVGQLAVKSGDTSLQAALLGLLEDPDLKTQLNAIHALGKLKDRGSEEALLALLAKRPRPEVERALVRALGKTGGKAADVALTALASESTPAEATSRVLGRAQLILKRELSREQAGRVLGDKSLAATGAPRLVWLHCRRGIETLLAAEAKAAGFTDVTVLEAGLVGLTHAGALDELWQLRLALHASLPVQAPGGDTMHALVTILKAASTQALLQAMTEGPVRYRLDLPRASKASIWDLAQRLAHACPALVNDPTASIWEFRLRQLERRRYLELVPKAWPDPRFLYRTGFVPASSHPTLAAALAQVAGVRRDDIVWDPFVGSGTELIERARLGPVASLWGTDTDPAALATAKVNAEAASLPCPLHLEEADALQWAGAKPTLTITNPPMGRRVQRGSLARLFTDLMPKLAATLAPGGRLVWLSPLPERTVLGLSQLGLRLTYQQTVDMGGFTAELQRWEKP